LEKGKINALEKSEIKTYTLKSMEKH